MSIQDTLATASAHIAAGRVDAALARLNTALAASPGNMALIRLKAAAAWQKGDLYGADDCLREMAASGEIGETEIDLMTAQLALDLLEFDRSRAAIDRLMARGETQQVANTAIRLLVWQGDRSAALEILEQALASKPDDPRLLALAVTHDPGISDKRLQDGQKLAENLPPSSPFRTGLLYPLARYFDRKGDYDRAWSLMMTANLEAAARNGQRHDARNRHELEGCLTRRATSALRHADTLPTVTRETDRDYIYLIGAPRTGSSLLQSILSAHEDVQSAGERGAMLPYLNTLCDTDVATPDPTFLKEVQAADRSGLERTGLTAKTVIDKTTHNFFVAPLIAAVHPGARFVNVTRRPHDVALSILFHDFPPAFPESTDIGTIIAALGVRRDVARIYAQAGFKVFDFDFDAFTAEPEAQGAKLAGVAGIPWQAETLSPERRNAAVPTFSAGQVRQPIRPTPERKWERFAGFISPEHRAALDDLSKQSG